jgi:hypothetical protein
MTRSMSLKAVEKAGGASVAVSDLIELLRNPPFGLRDGPIPVLLCLFGLAIFRLPEKIRHDQF